VTTVGAGGGGGRGRGAGHTNSKIHTFLRMFANPLSETSFARAAGASGREGRGGRDGEREKKLIAEAEKYDNHGE